MTFWAKKKQEQFDTWRKKKKKRVLSPQSFQRTKNDLLFGPKNVFVKKKSVYTSWEKINYFHQIWEKTKFVFVFRMVKKNSGFFAEIKSILYMMVFVHFNLNLQKEKMKFDFKRNFGSRTMGERTEVREQGSGGGVGAKSSGCQGILHRLLHFSLLFSKNGGVGETRERGTKGGDRATRGGRERLERRTKGGREGMQRETKGEREGNYGRRL